MRNFKDKVVVITGAGSGMGRAYALEFARLGAKLALNDYDAGALAETISLVRAATPVPIHSKIFDVADEDAMADFAAGVKTEFGNTDVVINNAGIEGSNQPVWATPIEAYRKLLGVNFHGVLNGTKAFLPQLMAQPEAALINVSSIFGLAGTPNFSDYCASKFAVRGFTEALMVELHKSNVSVHLVHPGGIDTNIARDPAGKAFKDRYLHTSPEKLVRHVIRCVRWKVPKIVYGKDSLRTWLGANLVPLRLLNAIIWHEMKSVIRLENYTFLGNRRP